MVRAKGLGSVKGLLIFLPEAFLNLVYRVFFYGTYRVQLFDWRLADRAL